MAKRNLILKQFASETKAIEGERALSVVITTNDVDRSGDIVEPGGAKLTNFKKNPVVLMAHDYSGLPIGKASDLTKTDNGITAKVIFPEEGTYPLADTVYNLYKQGFMKAWSIGFIPIKSEDIKDDEAKGNNKDEDTAITNYGKRFKIWELLEFSACSVPANPNALGNMLSKGIDVEPLKEAGFIEIEEAEKEKAEYDCSCIDCGYEMTSDKHCKELKCPECGGTMRRVERPGPGEESNSIDEINDGVKDNEQFTEEEKEKEEPGKSYNPNEIYEIVKENKELKEKIKEVELKAGAVLNAKNKSNLKQAQQLIQSVLDSAGIEEDSIDIEEEKSKGDEEINVIDITKDDPGIDGAKIEEIIDKVILENTKKVSEHFNRKLDYILGRVK